MGYINIAAPFFGWTVIRELGHGSFGKVYEIRRNQYGIVEQSAMKVIAVPQDPNEIRTYLRDGYSPETLRKMYNGSRASVLGEYQTMARLKDCPNIVRCEDIQVVMDPDGIGSKIYIRMELLTPVRDYEKLQSFNEEEVIKLGSDICNLLVRCEEEGIVHRDIKPGNIMVSGRGEYKLGDFGIARSMDHTTMATRIGTINYMAPEVYLGRKYGHAADIYSLGLVLYWLLNNRRMPFFPQDDSEINDNSAAAAQEMRMIGTPVPQPVNGSARLSKVVLKALAYDPADRYQSAPEFGNELRNCLSADNTSEMSYVGENDITGEYSQNATDVYAEMLPPGKENERRKQEEVEKNLTREADRRISRAEKIFSPEKKRYFGGIILGACALLGLICALFVMNPVKNREILPASGGNRKDSTALSEDGNGESVQKSAPETISVGDTYLFGSYEQDNNTANGTENIEWLVLAKEGDMILVISKYGLDYQQYDSASTAATWETCSLRKWLNGEFLNAAFSEGERSMIPSRTVSADKNPNYRTSPGNSTTDQVFLLSITEAKKYFNNESALQCQGTA